MPFQDCFAKAFRTAAVRREAPAASGVYGLSNALKWIYVGEADNIQATLLEHLEEVSTLPMENFPTGFSFELCSPELRVARQRRLILELEPACNGRMRGRSKSARSSVRERPLCQYD